LAMDDFGTGYSSLAYLKQFPLNTLKIDKAFIDDMDNARGRNMVDTIVTIAHNLSLNVVAEGVETKDQLDMLRKLRCETIQGYYYSKPLSAKDFAAFLFAQKQQPRLSVIPG
jgi:EAL domain-containing protein (putative c-di-GMP-specific phosphodiesterase class I)